MFSQTWKKYLPVIIILLKRSGKEEQVLNMNSSDFNRAAGGKKARLAFSNIHLNNGRVNSLMNTPPLAMDLFLALQENDLAKKVISNQYLEFTLKSNFQLIIKNNTPPAVMEDANASAEVAEVKDSE
jgi:hypothetical protein